MKSLKANCLILIILFTGISIHLNAQNLKLTGTIRDKQNQTPVIGAIVLLKEAKDTTIQYSALTNNNGYFVVDGLKSQSYKLTIQNISYGKIYRVVTINNQNLNLGIINMEPQSEVLKEVVVRGQGPTAVLKGDTTEMSSSAYKTNPDANAEDLVKKMPGITVENGTVKAQGEDVKKVLVDGKQFFGDDPTVALRNLPADVIDKIQIYNKLSDQAELTGVDDGNSSRTINIITRQNKRAGQFGKIAVGSDINEKYLVAGNLNIFKGNRRISILGSTNNINQQNFAMQDLLGTTSSGRGGGGGGFGGGRQQGGGNTMGSMGSFGGSQGGITKTNSLGLNYTDTWGKKINVNGSYFYNSTDNRVIQESNTENLFITDGKYSTNNSTSITKNYNHRMNMRVEYAIDSLNSIIFVPRLSFQQNDANNLSLYTTTGGLVNSSTNNSSITNGNGYNFSNDLTFRHKFMKPRRTFSIGINTSINSKVSENTQMAIIDLLPDNQYYDSNTDGKTISANLSYTEPIGKYSMVMLNYNNSLTKNNTDKETYQIGDQMEKISRLDSLFNVYNNDYNTNRGGLSYVFRTDKLNIRTGLDYQSAVLSGNQIYPQKADINKTFENILPGFMLIYKINKTNNLRMFYRTSTNAPSISQLQNVTDNSNRLSLSTGNPNLKQEYSHNFTTNYSFANPDKGINSFAFISGGYTLDNIGYRTIYAKRDTLDLPEYNVRLSPGAQLAVPVNLDYSYTIRSLFSFGVYAKPIRSNINVLAGLNYSQSPGYIDSLLNRSNSYSITNSLIFASNISEKIDFSLSYTSNYSIVENTAKAQNLSNTKYWYQSANAKVNWIFLKGFVLQSDLVGQFNKGLSESYNQNYMVWNASFGKKFMKSNAAELKISVFDILNQNKSISRTVTASTIQDSRTNTFPRYFMLVFTYNLKKFNGQKEPEQRENRDRPGFPQGGAPGFIPGGGMPHNHD